MYLKTRVTNPERIHRFLLDRAPASFCDDCLGKETGAALSHVNVITQTLGFTREFRRTQGACSLCQREKFITGRAELVPADAGRAA